MSKLDELQSLISNLFDNATDKTVIEQYGAVKGKIDDIKAEEQAQQDDYKNLLNDYKDVVIHQTYKPENTSGTGITPTFDADKVLAEALQANIIKN